MAFEYPAVIWVLGARGRSRSKAPGCAAAVHLRLEKMVHCSAPLTPWQLPPMPSSEFDCGQIQQSVCVLLAIATASAWSFFPEDGVWYGPKHS